MSHSAAPYEFLSPIIITPGLTKGKQTLSLPPGFQLSHAGLTLVPLFSRLFSRLPRKLHDPKTITHFCMWNVPHKHSRSRNICPTQRIYEVKQVRLRRLSKQQRRYWESMVSSIISNSCLPCSHDTSFVVQIASGSVLGLWFRKWA